MKEKIKEENNMNCVNEPVRSGQLFLQEQQILARRECTMVRLLGQGAFSQVFLVRRQDTSKLLACKVSQRQELIFREGTLLAKVHHPLFPEFYDMWSEGGQAFLLMEYVCGSSLETLLCRRGSFAEAQAARVGMELAQGLRFLHQMPEPVLFRDMKPANVMIRQDGRVKILDLGCACEQSQAVRTKAGTPGYAAPEQFEEDGILTPACDVYGLGRMLEAMSGKRGRQLKSVITVCTMPQPERRLPDMQEVMVALAPLCGSVSGSGRGRKQKWRKGIRNDIICEKNIWDSRHKNV